jgi:hypothetical protein
MTKVEFDIHCKELCPRCAAGDPIRQRGDSYEWVHDFAFGPVNRMLGRPSGMGHGLCSAHQFRTEWASKIDG